MGTLADLPNLSCLNTLIKAGNMGSLFFLTNTYDHRRPGVEDIWVEVSKRQICFALKERRFDMSHHIKASMPYFDIVGSRLLEQLLAGAACGQRSAHEACSLPRIGMCWRRYPVWTSVTGDHGWLQSQPPHYSPCGLCAEATVCACRC